LRAQTKTDLGGSSGRGWLARLGLLRPAVSALILATLAVGLVPGSASARTTRPYETSFGSLTEGVTRGITVDQSNGDVYVVTWFNDSGSGPAKGKISRFDSTGAPKNFTAGPDAGTNTLTAIREIGDVAIDSSGGPLDGTIYVSEGIKPSGMVRVFANDGESHGALTGSGTPKGSFGELNPGYSALTVDQSTGDVYVSAEAMIWRYSPKSPSGAIDDADFTVTGISPLQNSTNIALGSGNPHIAVGSGTIYTTRGSSDGELLGGTVQRYPLSAFAPDAPEVSGSIVEVEGVPFRAGSLAVDPETGELYAGQRGRVSVFDPSGALLYGFGASHYFSERADGIAVKSAGSGPAAKVYVSNTQDSGEVTVFGALTQAIVRTHPALASFGKDGSANTLFGLLPGNSAAELRLAFHAASHRLYAFDLAVSGAYGFDASAPPAFPPLPVFSPLPIGEEKFIGGLAVDNTGLGSAGNLYYASAAGSLIYGYSSSGAPLGGAFPIDTTASPGAPNGSPGFLGGVAVDSAGNIWVANRATGHILEYSSAGAYLSSVDVSAQGNEPESIAFDSDDNMYVVLRSKRGVWKYPAPAYASPTQIAPTAREVSGIAVDPSTDHLYLSLAGRIEEYDSAGNFLEEFATEPSGEESLLAITVDSLTHNVYVDEGHTRQIRAFGPGVILPDLALGARTGLTDTAVTLNASVGAQTVAISDCRFEYVKEAAFRVSGFADLSSGGSPSCGSVPTDLDDHPISAPISGLSPNTTYYYRLSTANANGSLASGVETFTTLGPPLAETTGAPVRSATSARLEGRVDPTGSPTSFHFEYGEQGPCDSNSCSSTEAVPAGSGNVYELAATQISGLQPNTTYHYRLVADNGNPGSPAFGQDMSVTTRPSDAPLSHGHFPGPPGSDRAYEQVSLPDSGGNPARAAFSFSDNGDRAMYMTSGGNPSSPTGSLLSMFFAERVETAAHAGRWQSTSVMPPRDQLSGSQFLFPSGPRDLSSFAILNADNTSPARSIWRLSPTAAPQRLFNLEPPQKYGGWYVGADNSSRVVAVLSGGSLDPDYPAASAVENIYDISEGTPKLASLLPGNALAPCGNVVPLAFSLKAAVVGEDARNWLSADGRLLFFDSGCVTPNLYMRDLDAEQTKLVSGPPLSGDDCGGILIKSNPQAAFFWTQSRLSAEDTDPAGCATATGSSGALDGDVYRYEIDSGALDCLTCLAGALDADVYPGNLQSPTAISANIALGENGTRLYFQSSNRLTPGAPAQAPGTGGSFYRLDLQTGDLRWIAAGMGDSSNESSAMQTTPDGAVVVFSAKDAGLNQLGTGTDNGGTLQFYRYDDRDRSLLCISCPPDGSAAAAPAKSTALGSGTGSGANLTSLSNQGIVAFTSSEPLVGADQNTARPGQDPSVGTDAYEWRDGRALLITDGLTNWPDEGPKVEGIGPSGRDLYFSAAIQYTQDAIDGYRRLYDARIDGGFEFPPPPKPCPLEVCQGTPKGAPEEQPPGSGSFAGPGNVRAAVQAKKHKKKSQKKKSQKKHQHKSRRQHKANDNRGVAR
jgi:hypothetical protein